MRERLGGNILRIQSIECEYRRAGYDYSSDFQDLEEFMIMEKGQQVVMCEDVKRIPREGEKRFQKRENFSKRILKDLWPQPELHQAFV